MIHPEDQGSPGWPATPIWRDDGAMEEPTGWPRYRYRRHGLFRWRGPRGRGPLRRRQSDRLAGGVAAGLASRLGFDVNVMRIAFVVATVFTGGTFAVGYVLAWLLVPAEGADGNLAGRALTDGRGLAVAGGIGSLSFFAWIIVSVLNAGWLSNLVWPLGLCVAGIVLIWRNAPADEQAAMRQLAEPVLSVTGGEGRSRIVLRVLLAAVLLIGGLATLLSGHHAAAFVRPLGGVALVIAAIVVAFGPWWLRIARDLVVERQARARAEERADMAARLHDSVLQTLALIQRRADDPQRVVQLARAQERELRSWLFEGRAPGSLDVMTLADGVGVIQQEVEAQYGIAVEAVTVGECELDDDLSALLAAAREATVNAAKWSGADVVSLFAEVEPAAVSLFVRDRGRGFDPEAVPGDRKGLAESVHGRMARRGGSATVRSVPGEGTEVSLTMPRSTGPRTAGERQPSRT
jgi:signal transduction histidine kinase/phage shock protein PspC (stress-responsive transcriptional regulator)